MNLQQFHNSMQQGRMFLYRRQFVSAVFSVINQIAITTTAVFAGLFFLNLLLGLLSNLHLQRIWILFIAVSIFAAFIFKIWTKCTKITWQQVACELDIISNRHNLIFSAYEFVDSGRKSPFAQITIVQGLEMLSQVNIGELKKTKCKLNTAILTAACITVIACFLSFSVFRSNFKNSDIDKNCIMSKALLKSVQLQTAEIADNLTMLSDNQQNFSNSYAGYFNTAVQNSGVLTASSALSAGKNTKGDNLSIKGRQQKVSSQAKSGALKFSCFAQTGFSITPPEQTNMKTDMLYSRYVLEQDQLEEIIEEKRGSNNISSSSKRPFLDSQNTAVSRELGTGGKKGKLGNGRGGSGAVKKSRSTASLFTGEHIPVHIKSRPNNGKSKSFRHYIPVQPLQGVARNPLAVQKSNEAGIRPYVVQKHLKAITQKYFEELYSYANRTN